MCLSLKQLLNLLAMEWTEGAVGDQPLGPIFHVPHPSGQPHFLSSTSAKRKDTSDKSTMTSHTIPHLPTPSPTPPPSYSPIPPSNPPSPTPIFPSYSPFCTITPFSTKSLPTKKAKYLGTVRFVKSTLQEVMI